MDYPIPFRSYPLGQDRTAEMFPHHGPFHSGVKCHNSHPRRLLLWTSMWLNVTYTLLLQVLPYCSVLCGAIQAHASKYARLYSRYRGIPVRCRGFAIGERESQNANHRADSDPRVSSCDRHRTIKRPKHLTATSTNPKPPAVAKKCRMDRGTRKTAPCQIYRDIAVSTCQVCSSGAGNICATYQNLDTRYVFTSFMRYWRHRPRV
jgi:hypothetical protein